MKETIGFAVEGECFVGKSTTLKELIAICLGNGRPACLIPEYFELGKLTSESRTDRADVIRIQDEIITLEKKRTELTSNQLAKDKDSIVGFDRSFLSCLSFELGMRLKRQLDGFDYLLERYQNELSNSNLILPSQIIHLVAKSQTIEQRRQTHIAKGHKDASSFLNDFDVRNLHYKYITQWGKISEKVLKIDVDNLNEAEVVYKCLRLLKYD